MYNTGDIVLVKTHDPMFGAVTVPAVVRYYDKTNGAYELNVYLDDGSSPADQSNIHWWTVTDHEIAMKVGEVSIQDPLVKRKGTQTFRVTRL